ncbi:hypothetical protein [Caldisericum sp.]|uniref:hypothetical protein n=1 Tax=Caldisericum sp. TaxID=2499687 RepID=UPI003D146427
MPRYQEQLQLKLIVITITLAVLADPPIVELYILTGIQVTMAMFLLRVRIETQKLMLF